MVPFDQPEAALVSRCVDRLRTPYTNSTFSTGSHHKMDQERPSYKLISSLSSEGSDVAVYRTEFDLLTLEYKRPMSVIPSRPWSRWGPSETYRCKKDTALAKATRETTIYTRTSPRAARRESSHFPVVEEVL